MQLLLDYTAADPAWRTAFDARAEARGAASLSLLQIWENADAPGQLTCLFRLGDRARAEEWLKVEMALHGAGAARFLRTATA